MKKLCSVILALLSALTLCLGLTACDKTVEQLQNELGALLVGGEFEEGSVLNLNTVDTTSESGAAALKKLRRSGSLRAKKQRSTFTISL